MQLYKVVIQKILVIASPDEVPTELEVEDCLRSEMYINGLNNSDIVRWERIDSPSQIPSAWANSIPWPIDYTLDLQDRTVTELLEEKIYETKTK